MSISDPKILLERLHNGLNILEVRRAKYGINIPLDLIYEIEDHRQAIELTNQLVAGKLNEKEWREAIQPLIVAVKSLGDGLAEPTIFSQSGQSVDSQINIAGDVEGDTIAGSKIVINQPTFNYLPTSESIPQKRPVTGFRNRRVIPPLLPHLPDRDEQEIILEETLARLSVNPARPVVCIVHGDELQDHDMFLERLKQISLPKALHLDYQNTAVSDYHLPWPSSLPDIANLHARLKRNLSEEILDQSASNLDEVNKSLVQHPGAVIVHTHIFSEDILRHGMNAIEAYLQFWQEYPDLSLRQRLIVCLFIKYQPKNNSGPLTRWRFERVNRKILKAVEVMSFANYHRLICTVLPKLTDISRSQTESWARGNAVRTFCKNQDIFSEIRVLYQKWEQEKSRHAIPMTVLAEKLRDILTKYSEAME